MSNYNYKFHIASQHPLPSARRIVKLTQGGEQASFHSSHTDKTAYMQIFIA